MYNDKYSAKEAGVKLSITAQMVRKYFKHHNIGEKIGRDLWFTADDIEKIKKTDGRRKK